ncbi:MAG: hypothetical protein M1840_007118 [Geoglossum simile]|nr:MAG: hypothetical protein M1840_007118 [Geoglossum simile]
MSDSAQTIDDDLGRSGFAVVGKIDQSWIENVKRYLDSAVVQQQQPRLNELEWSSHCDFVVADFKTKLKPAIMTL